MDAILLKNCRFYGYHGVLSEEQNLGQVFTVNIELSLDLTAASLSDDLNQTVHYGMVFDCIKNRVENYRYQLLEKLAGIICEDLFSEFSLINKIIIDITKENPPINGHYDAVGVRLERNR